ncbi:hypothetical protein PYW08_012046 [Mythimna loreyi]|uniref:Uncharacterized protein n=1 Tax=Mythimna loreyi TaxID=667449 RepID=A0ACC2QQ61_9NEOP|nr:hypothetical protein PYW08_012046 [Mythimna loreyi]
MSKKPLYHRFLDEPAMSDKTLLVSVEDLIASAFGPTQKNTVNFKLLQTILHILARQLRLLEQDVEIKFDDMGFDFETGRPYDDSDEYSDDDDDYYSDDDVSSTSSRRTDKEGTDARKERGKKMTKKDREKEEEGEDKGEKKEKRSKDRKKGRKHVDSSSPDGRIDEVDDEGTGRDGRGKRHRGRRKRDEDDEEEDAERRGHGRRRGGRKKKGEEVEDEGEERHGHGRRRGGRKKRGEEVEDEGVERDGHGRRHGRRKRKGEDDEDEGDERDGRRHGRSKDRRRRRGAGKEESETSITVKEGPRRDGGGGRVARVGSIEVVTASQFALLARAVRQLEQVTGPVPMPELPDNEQLREDVLKGRASLSETMEAVQLSARVQAAEEGLSRMAGLLTQLTAAGALPIDLTSRIGDLQAVLGKSSISTGQSSMERRGLPTIPEPGSKVTSTRFAETVEQAGADAGTELQKEGVTDSKTATTVSPSGVIGGAAGASVTARASTAGADGAPSVDDMPVTQNEMQDVLEQMKEALSKDLQTMTARANHQADMASNTTRNVSEKLERALGIDDRITELYSQTADYAEQLNGFDTGLATQVPILRIKPEIGELRGKTKALKGVPSV